MSERAPKRISDGSISFEGGVDTGRSPNLVARNQVVWAVNTTFYGAFCSTRPGWKKLPFSADGIDGTFQCCGGYVSDDGHKYLVFLIGGRVFIWDKKSTSATEITIPGDPNPSIFNQGWMLQAENYLIIQDGFSRPLIWDGATLRRAANNEIKCGTVMGYVQGRIWYSLTNGLSFRATDLVYGNGERSDVLKETENDFLNEGGDFTVSQDSGGITGIGIPAVLNTALGQGPLLIMTPKYVFSINAPTDRTVWKNLNYPIQSISLVNYGSVSARSCVTVNGDVYYRAPDGIRSFFAGLRQFSDWGNTPQSNEMTFLLKQDQTDLLAYSSGITFNNRLLMTASPYHTDKGILHRAISVLEFNLISGLKGKLPPSWEGMWTGLDIHQLVKVEYAGNENAYIISRNPNTLNVEIWEITKDDDADSPALGTQTPIQWEIQTKAYNFDQQQFKKRLDSAEIWVDDIRGTCVFDVKYKPDQYPAWVCWNSWSECANINLCSGSGCGGAPIQNLQPQYRTKMRLPTPSDACDPILGEQFKRLFDVQLRIAMTGHARIKLLRVNAIEIQEPTVGECRTDSACTSLALNCSSQTSCDCSILDTCAQYLFAYRSDPGN